jgi:DUF4097 and DUF4098 domain-containing protein YvlB
MTYALIFAAWSLFGSGPHAEQHFTFAVSGAVRMRVETANGKIAVTTGQPGSAVAVTAVKRADTIEQVNALGVDARRSGNEIVVRALYPKGCGSGSCGGEVSFTIVAPPGTSFDLNSSNGSVDASGVGGNASLSTSNGSVSASYAAFANVRSVTLSTQNGNVSLMLPSSAKIGRVKMDTAVGRINSDWPVRIDRTSFVGGSVNQTLAPGAASIMLTTTNGSITLKKT